MFELDERVYIFGRKRLSGRIRNIIGNGEFYGVEMDSGRWWNDEVTTPSSENMYVSIIVCDGGYLERKPNDES